MTDQTPSPDVQRMFQFLAAQRNSALDAVASLNVEVEKLRTKVNELETENAELKKKGGK